MKPVIFIFCIEAVFLATLRCDEKPDTLQIAGDSEFERTLELASEEGNTAPVADILDGLQEHPVDLNRASAAELQQIPGLSPLLAYKIISQRALQPFESVEDLSKIEGITPSMIRELDPFVAVRKRSATAMEDATQVHFRTRAVQSVVQRHGIVQKTYPSSPEDVYNRLVARIGSIRGPGGFGFPEPEYAAPSVVLGVVTAKDPGEKNYLDLLSGYVQAIIPSLSTRLLLGDFVMEGGQGLVFWRPSGFSKGSEATANVGRNGIGLRPSLSSTQTWMFRGVGAEVALNDLSLCLFYSNRQMDAVIDSAGSVTSIDLDGIHRTEADLQRRNRLREKAMGARLSFSPSDGLKIGASGFRIAFDRLLTLPGPFGFQGTGYYVLGTDISYTRPSVSVFTEVSQDCQRGVAGVFGVLLSPRSGLTLALLARAYPRDFKNFHGSAFGERGSSDGDESGVYCGISYRSSDWLTLSTYYDQFTFPWPTSALSLPSSGNEMLCEAEFKLSSRLGLDFRFRQKEKPVHVGMDGSIALSDWGDVLRRQRNYRATLKVGSMQSLIWESRIEAVAVSYPSRQALEHGTMVFQDFSFTPLPRLSVRARAIAYETDSYDSRVYEFEEDSPGTYLDPALSGKGFRWYLIVRYQHGRWLGLSVKYSQTRWEGRRASGDLESVSGDLENRLAVQVDVTL